MDHETSTCVRTPRFTSCRVDNLSTINKVSSNSVVGYVDVDQTLDEDYTCIRSLPKKLSIHFNKIKSDLQIKQLLISKEICPKANSNKVDQLFFEDTEEIEDMNDTDFDEPAIIHLPTENFVILKKLKQIEYNNNNKQSENKEKDEHNLIENAKNVDSNDVKDLKRKRKKEKCGCLF